MAQNSRSMGFTRSDIPKIILRNRPGGYFYSYLGRYILVVIDNEFDFGNIVYLKTDPEQHERIIVGIWARGKSIRYDVSFKESESSHFGVELSTDRDILKALKN
jgi:hypothetical protein